MKCRWKKSLRPNQVLISKSSDGMEITEVHTQPILYHHRSSLRSFNWWNIWTRSFCNAFARAHALPLSHWAVNKYKQVDSNKSLHSGFDCHRYAHAHHIRVSQTKSQTRNTELMALLSEQFDVLYFNNNNNLFTHINFWRWQTNELGCCFGDYILIILLRLTNDFRQRLCQTKRQVLIRWLE